MTNVHEHVHIVVPAQRFCSLYLRHICHTTSTVYHLPTTDSKQVNMTATAVSLSVKVGTFGLIVVQTLCFFKQKIQILFAFFHLSMLRSRNFRLGS